MFERYVEASMRSELSSLDSHVQSTRFGPGALHEVGDIAARQGIDDPLVVVDPFFVASEALGVLLGGLHGRAHTWSKVSPTPRVADVEAAASMARETACNGVISMGGGSALDVGKGAALLASGGTIHDMAHGHAGPHSALPHVAIPSTAGTGAEQSPFAFFVEEHGREHTVVHHASLVPSAAIIDPVLQSSMPPRLTAATGLNALANAVEAYLSPSATDTGDEFALEAMAGIHGALLRAVKDGADLEARTTMAQAAYRAGQAFSEAGLGLVDSVSLVLSGLFDIGHSQANALVLPSMMQYQAKMAGDRMPAVAKALGAGPGGAVEAVEELRRAVGMGESLADHGITWDDIYLCAHAIVKHPFNPRGQGLTPEGVAEVMVAALGMDASAPGANARALRTGV